LRRDSLRDWQEEYTLDLFREEPLRKSMLSR
jgi:hypothetical protein